MLRDTILYVREKGTSGDPVFSALKASGSDIVSTSSFSKAIALLFVMRLVCAVVLDQRKREKVSLKLARSLRAVRPAVPIVLLCHEQADCAASCLDACISAGEPLEKLTSTLHLLATAKRSQETDSRPASAGGQCSVVGQKMEQSR